MGWKDVKREEYFGFWSIIGILWKWTCYWESSWWVIQSIRDLFIRQLLEVTHNL